MATPLLLEAVRDDQATEQPVPWIDMGMQGEIEWRDGDIVVSVRR